MAQDKEAVDDLWREWKSGDDSAYSRLVQLGPEARAVAERILQPDGEVQYRWPENGEIRLLRALQADAVPAILRALRNCPQDERIEFVTFLESLGRMARPADDALMNIALDEVGAEREAALRALAQTQSKNDFLIPELIRLLAQAGNSRGIPLQEPDHSAYFAAELLGKCRDLRAARALERAIRRHPEAQVRCCAVSSYVQVAASTDRAPWSKLIPALEDREATFLGAFGSGSTADTTMGLMLGFDAVPATAASGLIMRLYRDSYEGLSVSPQDLAEVICRCPTTDPYARELVARKLRPLLAEDAYFRGTKWEAHRMRVAAACVVLRWNPTDPRAAETLLRAAAAAPPPRTDAFPLAVIPDVRPNALLGLGKAGPDGRVWLPQVRELWAQATELRMRFAGAWAVAQLDPEDEDCVRVLQEADDDFRQWQKISWSEMQRVLGRRAALLTDRQAVLDEMSTPGLLLRAAKDQWKCAKLQAHETDVLPIVCGHLESEDVEVRQAALVVLGQMRCAPARVVPRLVASLRDRRAVVRATAAEVLGRYAAAARDAVPALQEATRDEYLTVRVAAEDALAAIQPARP